MALLEQFGVTERRACRVVGQSRSTQRLKPPIPSDDELALRAWLRDFARRRPRWGWRRAAVEAKKAGWRANHKRIHRLWVAEGLRVPYKKRKKPLRGIGKPVGAMCPIRPNVIWAMDFQFDQTSDGRMLKFLNVVDEFTREALATDVERSIDADGVVRCLDRLAADRGAPAYVRFDIQDESALESTSRPAGEARLRGDRCPLAIAVVRSERAATPCLLGARRAGAPPGGNVLLGTR